MADELADLVERDASVEHLRHGRVAALLEFDWLLTTGDPGRTGAQVDRRAAERPGRGSSEDQIAAPATGALEVLRQENLQRSRDDRRAGPPLALGIDFTLVLVPAALHLDATTLEIDVAHL